MATRKISSSSEKQLKSTVKKLEAKLARADAKAARWKKEAKRQQAAVASSQARVTELRKKLSKARRSARHPITTRAVALPPAEAVPQETTVSAEAAGSTPDASWTVAQLRAEARSRGVTGLSGKSKAEIITALTGTPS